MSNRLSIRVISWNLGEAAKKGVVADWNTEFASWSILEEGPDIIFLSVEEASDPIGKKIGEALKTKMKDYDIFFEGEGTHLPSMDFHVFGYLCIKKANTNYKRPVEGSKKDKTIDTICIRKKQICTKPSVGVGVEIKKGGYDSKSIVFIGSHLPVVTKDKETYGYQARLDAMKLIREKLLKNVEVAIGSNAGADAVFWTGDFNYRIQDDGTEQLAQAMKTDILSGFAEHELGSVVQTCRYLEYKGNNEEEMESIGIERITPGKSTDPNLKIYDPKRIPSFCDRVIYKIKPGTTFVPENYYSWPNDPEAKYPVSILRSDHTPIVLEGYIELKESDKPRPVETSRSRTASDPATPPKPESMTTRPRTTSDPAVPPAFKSSPKIGTARSKTGGYYQMYSQNKLDYLRLVQG